MSKIKKVAIQQYRNKIRHLEGDFSEVLVPPEGCIRTMRKALVMSGAQLARKLGVTRASVSNIEKAEVSGGVTLKKMQAMAQAMDCRFVYAIVPKTNLDDVLKTQATKKARAIVDRATTHMALEDQALTSDQTDLEVERLANEILESLSSTIWDD